MIVDSLSLNKDGSYTIIINDKSYTFDEEVIIKYRLVKGKEITEDILEKAINSNDLMKYYNKALSYSIKYGKSQYEVYEYLLDKGLSNIEANQIISDLINAKAIDDSRLIKAMINTLVYKQNGRLMIEHKLYEHKFSKDLINKELNEINYDSYFEALNKLYNKVKDKYKDEEYIRIQKIKKYLLSRGYTYSDIETINFKGE